MSSTPDVIVVGAGIIGSACARELAVAGLSVLVLERGRRAGATTAANMGHIIVTDDSPPQLALTRWSQGLWRELADELPPEVEWDPCGAIWVADDEDTMAVVRDKAEAYRSLGMKVEVLDAGALAEAEPRLRRGLAGGLRMTEDSVVYPPAASRWLLARAEGHGAEVREDVAVHRVTGSGVVLEDGTRLDAGAVVDAAGNRALDLLPRPLPGVEIRPRKGHLAITERYPGFCRHQLVELDYLRSAHTHTAASVAFNVQPRTTDQVLIGSSRQYGSDHDRVEPGMLRRMLARAVEYMPDLADLQVTRAWTGFRPATEDKLPLVGPVPEEEGLWLAAGHEGLGITTSLGTARLVAASITGAEPEIDPAPFRVDRGMDATREPPGDDATEVTDG